MSDWKDKIVCGFEPKHGLRTVTQKKDYTKVDERNIIPVLPLKDLPKLLDERDMQWAKTILSLSNDVSIIDKVVIILKTPKEFLRGLGLKPKEEKVK